MRSDRIGIILIIGIILVGILYYFNSKNNEYNWAETYEVDSKEPYGTYIFENILSKYPSTLEFKEIKKPLLQFLEKNKVSGPTNYVLITNRVYWTSNEMDSILAFVLKGNTMLVSANHFPDSLISKIYGSSDFSGDILIDDGKADSIRTLNFEAPQLKDQAGYRIHFATYKNKITNYKWRVFSTNIDSVYYESLGIFNEKNTINFVRIPYGDGTILLHSAPLIFTNYHLLNESNIHYTERILSYLPKGNVYWDETSGYYHYENSSHPTHDSPLKFILNKRSLRWAWYLLLTGLVLYFLFRSKRKQSIIPVFMPNKNTSIMFIETIGKLYFIQNNHKKMAELKLKHLLHFIRIRYQYNISNLDETNIEKIIQLSGVDRNIVEAILKTSETISKQYYISKDVLMKQYILIQTFYKNCK